MLRNRLAFVLLAVQAMASVSTASERPNILWIYLEDVSGWFSCYGDTVIETPHIDALAGEGVRFDRFYTPAGVCSATRSAIMVGTMQTSFGIHNHRSGRADPHSPAEGSDVIELPEEVETVAELFKKAGYFTFNSGGKDDYNFAWEAEELYDYLPKTAKVRPENFLEGKCLAERKDDQPFFGQIQLKGGKLGLYRDSFAPDEARKVSMDSVTVPPYYPDIPMVREEIAHHYDCLLETDRQVGQIIETLKENGDYENTLIILFSDHGYRMPRHKQFLYEGGIRMPLIIAGPRIAAGQARRDLVSGIDIAPTSLAAAGLEVPRFMEGRDVLAKEYSARDFVVAARDRCDFTIDRIRAIVSDRYKYLRNGMTDRPYLQPNYRDNWAIIIKLREMAAKGELDPVQMRFFADYRPSEELYDLQNDPHEIHNLADDPKYAGILSPHRTMLDDWIRETGDKGQLPESAAGLLTVLKRWKDRCVNPEFDGLREGMKPSDSPQR